jgi:Asp-tRNA(Asn)/Glu-tRNA(Gln) amidotransferase A subunit family amidase
MSVNCGFTSTGLPIGLQIVAPAYREDLALAAAAAFESVRGPVKWPGM